MSRLHHSRQWRAGVGTMGGRRTARKQRSQLEPRWVEGRGCRAVTRHPPGGEVLGGASLRACEDWGNRRQEARWLSVMLELVCALKT